MSSLLKRQASQLQVQHGKEAYDVLYKELEKKDHRNELLAKELKEARNKKTLIEKEYYVLSYLFEKINGEIQYIFP